MVKEGSTKNYKFNGVKLLVFGPPDSGKTYSLSTAPKPFIFMADKGGLSLKDFDIPCDQINSGVDFEEAIKWIVDNKASAKYETFAFDDLTTIGDIILTEEAAKITNPKDYLGKFNALQARMMPLLRQLRDISPKHIVFTCKEIKEKDGMSFTYSPDFPGNAVTKELPYFFDYAFHVRIATDSSGQKVIDPLTNKPYRIWLTQGDHTYKARSRQGTRDFLDELELADINQLISKIKSNVK